MSGGYFHGKEWQVQFLADELEHLLVKRAEGEGIEYDEAIYQDVEELIPVLEKAFERVRNLDRYLEGDRSLSSYKEELEILRKG